MQSHTQFFPRWTGAATIFAILLLIGLCRAAEAQTNFTLPELINKANALTDLSAVGPYEVHARIAVNPGSKQEQLGELTIYRDQNRSRLEVQLGDFHQVEVISGDTRYVSRTRPYPLTGLDVLNNVEDAVHLRTSFPKNTKFSAYGSRKVHGVSASCFDAKLYQGKMRFCFDSRTGAVLEASDYAGWRGRFSGYVPAGVGNFPTSIELTQPGKPRHVELSEIRVTSRKFDDASFAAPQGAHAFPVCNGMAGARAALDSQWSISSTHMGEIYVYAIVEADGRARDLTVYGGSKWMQREVSKLARKWNFLAAQCGSTTITSEVLLPLVRAVSEGDYSSGTSPSSFSSEKDNSPQNTSTDTTQYLNYGMPK